MMQFFLAVPPEEVTAILAHFAEAHPAATAGEGSPQDGPCLMLLEPKPGGVLMKSEVFTDRLTFRTFLPEAYADAQLHHRLAPSFE